MIFHIPFQLTGHVSGTHIRPHKMKRAFENIGYEVELIEGNGKKRKHKIQEIKKRIRSGIKYEFLYSESSTEPTLLTEKHHLPVFPFLDFGFFAYCRRNGIPIGLFYRDIHWNFPFYGKGLSIWKQIAAKLFYRYDLRRYKQLLSVLYLPSLKMQPYIPTQFPQAIKALPPAAIFEEGVSATQVKQYDDERVLRVFYVGGLGHIYKIHQLFEVVSQLKEVHLTVCCREKEWEARKPEYEPYLSQNIQIVHKGGEDLIPLYVEADLVSLFVAPHEYWNFAMAIKLFEYIRFRRPVIATSGTAVGAFVEKENIGWTIPYSSDALRNLFTDLLKDHTLLEKKAARFSETIKTNTWEARARQVEKDLLR